MKKKGRLTAAEFVAQLQADPEYVAQREQHRATLAAHAARRQEMLAPILAEITASGYPAVTLDDLIHTHSPLPAAVSDILLDRLPRTDDVVVQEQLVRALGAGRGFPAQTLLELFERTDAPLLRWAIANTLAEGRPSGAAAWLRAAVINPAYGDARQMMPLALARVDDPSTANRILREVFDELPGHVALAWAESGGAEELEILRQARGRFKAWVRREIDKAIKAIERRIDG